MHFWQRGTAAVAFSTVRPRLNSPPMTTGDRSSLDAPPVDREEIYWVVTTANT
jgi:hypothetical protein